MAASGVTSNSPPAEDERASTSSCSSSDNAETLVFTPEEIATIDPAGKLDAEAMQVLQMLGERFITRVAGVAARIQRHGSVFAAEEDPASAKQMNQLDAIALDASLRLCCTDGDLQKQVHEDTWGKTESSS